MTLERENEIQALFENEIADVECHINVPDSMSHLKFCYFKLKKNNLRVLVVSDPTTKKASASMDVSVGSWCDPSDYPGLAHFLEHMLFMGTEKYPEENKYQDFLSKNGGSSNAYTASESTNYYFDVLVEKFSEALDIFAQFFISPLMKEDSTERELNAVNSEHSNNLQNDSWRVLQLRKELANQRHPFTKFGTGNKETLSSNEKSERLVRDALIEFHSTYYFASVMNLCLFSSHSIEEIIKMVLTSFQEIPDKSEHDQQIILQEKFPIFEDPITNERLIPHAYSSSSLGKIIKTVPIKEMHLLRLYFPVKSTYKEIEFNPTGYLSHLFGHEGKGSIFYVLQKKGWADELSAGNMVNNSDFVLFTIAISLTEVGLLYVNDVIDLVFQYAIMIRDSQIPFWIFDELQSVSNISFKFQEELKPDRFVVKIANSMNKRIYDYPMKDIFRTDNLHKQFSKEKILNYLSEITPNNLLAIFSSKSFEGITDREEKWYSTKYKIDSIDDVIFDRFNLRLEGKLNNKNEEEGKERREGGEDELEDPFALHLPSINPFIVHLDELTLVAPPNDPPLSIKGKAKKVVEEEQLTVYHKLDDVFYQPKINIGLTIISDEIYKSVKHNMLYSILSSMIQEALNDISYNALIFQTKFAIQTSLEGLQISFSGLSHAVEKLLPNVVNSIVSFFGDEEYILGNVRRKSFDVQKEIYKKSLVNYNQAQPYVLSIARSNDFLNYKTFPIHLRLQYIDELKIEDLLEIRKEYFKNFHLRILYHGNITQKRAEEISREVFADLKKLNENSTSNFDFDSLLQRSFQIPSSSLTQKKGVVFNWELMDKDQKNSAIDCTFITGEESPRNDMLTELLANILSEPLFDILRTKKQLGYIVFSQAKIINGATAFEVLIQSHSPPPLLFEILQSVISSFQEMLSEMSVETIEEYKKALILKMSERDRELLTETNRYWSDIQAHTFVFERLKYQLEEIKSFTKEDVIDFFTKYIDESPSRRLLISRVFTQEKMAEHKENGNDDDFAVFTYDNLVEFKQKGTFFKVPPQEWLKLSSL